jgi:hypothetical protein
MLSHLPQGNRKIGSVVMGFTALYVMLAPLAALAQQTQQTAQPAHPPATKPAPAPLRPAPVANGANTTAQPAASSPLMRLLHGGNNSATPAAQTASAATNNAQAAANNPSMRPGAAANGTNTTAQPAASSPLMRLLHGGNNSATPTAQTASAATNNAQINSAHLSASQLSGEHGNANTSRAIPAMANQPTGRAVPSQNFIGHPGPAGSVETRNRNGDIVRKAADGSIIDVHSPRNGLLIHHALNGNRRVVVDRPDHSRIVASSRGVQYVQHPYSFGGRTYDHRTFYAQGKVFHQLYRPYNYGGATLDVYATSRYYEPKFYQWATTRQSTPQAFSWSYTNNPPPWFGYYRGYFTPDTSYSSPSLWLTDFVLASSLSSHYQNNTLTTSNAPPVDASAGITPEIKQAVAEEVTRQVKEESLEAQQNAQHKEPEPGAGSVVNEMSDRQQHTFVVDSDLDLVDPSGRRCMISEGDVVQTSGGSQAGAGTASAIVLASKGGVECGRATQVEIALADLQEMQNHMRETIDQGMANTNAAKSASSVTPEFAKAVPPADPDAGHEIEREQQLAAAADG